MAVWLKLVLPVVAAAAMVWLGWWAMERSYLKPRATLQESINSRSEFLDDAASERRLQPRLEAQLQQYADRTLGGDLQSVDHRLRSRLNRVGEEIGLKALTVGTGSATSQVSPARSQFRGRSSVVNLRALREEIDFVEVQGWISGHGSLEQVVQLIHRVQAEPWLKYVDQVKLDPKENGQRVDVTLRLKTLFLPGRSPSKAVLGSSDTEVATAAAVPDRYAALIKANPFAVPPSKPTAPPVATGKPLAPPPFPYGQWILTGVAESGGIGEIWLLNRKSGESRRLAVGESLHELVLAAAEGDRAEFQIAQERFSVAVGQNLLERTSVSTAVSNPN